MKTNKLTPEQQDILSKLVASFGTTCTRADLQAFQKKTKLPVLVNWIQKHKIGRGQYDLTQGTGETQSPLNVKVPKDKKAFAVKASKLQRPTTSADESFTDAANSAGLRKLMGGIESPTTHAGKTKGTKLRTKGRRVIKDDDLDDGFGRMGDLRREARQLANGLGHQLGKFKSRAYTEAIQNSYCTECLKLAIVNDSPAFEGMTHVYGPAVEEQCSGHAPTLRGTFGGDDE